MKNAKTLLIIVVMLFVLPILNYGQSHEMVVPDMMESSKFLEEFILGDTTATGQRADLDRVYVLKRGGQYYVSILLQNQSTKTGSWPLRIKAQDGSGPRPVIYAYRNVNGSYNSEIFRAYGNIELKGIALVGWAEGLEDFDRNVTRIIRGSGGDIVIDDCILTNGSATLLHIDVATKYVKLTNSIFANSANLKQTNLGNGRAVDFRDVGIDSVYIENCSFMNFTDRVIRHYNAKAPINKLYLCRNTFLNILAEHGCISLGLIQGDITINNNLFVDNFIFGNDTTAYKEGNDSRLNEFAYTNEVGANGKPIMTFIGSVPNDTSYIKWTIKNNYYSVSPSVQSFYDSHNPPGLGDLIPLTHHIRSKLGSDSVNAFKKVSSPIVFKKAPKTPIAFAEWFFTPLDQGGAGKSKSNANFSLAVDFDRRNVKFYEDTLDLSYQTTSEAFTGATDGKPVGDLNWWKDIVSVKDINNVIPSAYVLEQNYPNPFNPITKIAYAIPQDSKVKLEVYDILGKKVATLVDGFQNAGQYKIDFNGSQLSSGIYFYQLSTPEQVITKKMVLIK